VNAGQDDGDALVPNASDIAGGAQGLAGCGGVVGEAGGVLVVAVRPGLEEVDENAVLRAAVRLLGGELGRWDGIGPVDAEIPAAAVGGHPGRQPLGLLAVAAAGLHVALDRPAVRVARSYPPEFRRKVLDVLPVQPGSRRRPQARGRATAVCGGR
jgi:hypothetical protein